jgi:WD40 repeat protein
MRTESSLQSPVPVVAAGKRRIWRSAGTVSVLLLVAAAACVLASEPRETKDGEAPAASQNTREEGAPSTEPTKPVMVAAIAASPDGKWLAAGTGFNDQPGELVLWDVAARRPKWVQRHDLGIRAVAISPDGNLVAAGHFDGRARVSSLETGAIAATLEGHSAGVNSIAFSPDGKSLVTGSLDTTIKIWNMATRTLVKTLAGHEGEVFSVAVSPDGTKIASASRDTTARLWDFKTGDELHTLKGHANGVEMVAFAPEAPLLATASWDATVKLWNSETGAEQATLAGHATRASNSGTSTNEASRGKSPPIRKGSTPSRLPQQGAGSPAAVGTRQSKSGTRRHVRPSARCNGT